MTTTAAVETHGFQTEVRQLLQLMIHSLYSNKDIFLRELISNASDAADKLRFEALAAPGLLEEQPELVITVELDKEAGTIAVSDNGIGMSRTEVIDNLGTIARSGTAEFLRAVSSDSSTLCSSTIGLWRNQRSAMRPPDSNSTTATPSSSRNSVTPCKGQAAPEKPSRPASVPTME